MDGETGTVAGGVTGGDVMVTVPRDYVEALERFAVSARRPSGLNEDDEDYDHFYRMFIEEVLGDLESEVTRFPARLRGRW